MSGGHITHSCSRVAAEMKYLSCCKRFTRHRVADTVKGDLTGTFSLQMPLI